MSRIRIVFLSCIALTVAVVLVGQTWSTNASVGNMYLPLLTVPGVPKTFLETFDGEPSNPQPWQPANWDVTVHSRDIWVLGNDELDPMAAAHGSDCAPPPATHTISTFEDAVFICRNHVMTAINAGGYGVIYLTPNHMVDFSQQEAVIRFDVSTARTSGRDWIDLWITPYEDNLQLPLNEWLPDLSGEPRRAINVAMSLTRDQTEFKANIVRDFSASSVASTNVPVYEQFLVPSPTRRDTFELRISRTHMKFGMPDYNVWWVDTTIPALDWDQGVVQLGHHSYNPAKACDGCGPNTWHWDNVNITPSVPFTILRADRRYVAEGIDTDVTFPKPAPANAHLRFAGIGNDLAVSFDAGQIWQPAQLQAQEKIVDEHFRSYWMPIPAGVSSVQFRGASWWGGDWHVRDISIWAQDIVAR